MKTADTHFEYQDGDFHSAQYALRLCQRKVEGISIVAQVKGRIVSAMSSSGWKDETYARWMLDAAENPTVLDFWRWRRVLSLSRSSAGMV